MTRELILSRTDRSGDCWLWTGVIDHYGYGKYGNAKAHRLSYEAFVGPIPAGLTIDHICFVRPCVNPDHLQPLTLAENSSRTRKAMRTHCLHGHPYSAANTYRAPTGARVCRKCNAEAARRLKARRKETRR